MTTVLNQLPKPEFVGIPGGSSYARDKDGVEARDSKNVDGTVIYRVTRPIKNPQEAAVAAAKERHA